MNHFKPIITDIDDQDAYKYFMHYAVLKHYPDAEVEYTYTLRDKSIKFPDGFDIALQEQIESMEDLRYTDTIINHLMSKLPYFDSSYPDNLRAFRYNPGNVNVKLHNGELSIKIRGYWRNEIWWEVNLLSIITELYYRMTIPNYSFCEIVQSNAKRNSNKFQAMKEMNIKVAEFGTRRRFSKENQNLIIDYMKRYLKENLIGTSNVMFARKYDIKAIGTMAHEWPMFHAAKYGPEQANREMLGKWVSTFHGNLGIALPDTFTTDVFLRSFDIFYAKLFDGMRHDSGSPIEFAKKVIEHYRKLNIVLPWGLIPKTIPFTDSIDSLEKIQEIKDYCDGKIMYSFGIGTWLTNDIIGVKPISHVIKMSRAKPKGMMWRDTIKLPDDFSKKSGDSETFEIYKKLLNL